MVQDKEGFSSDQQIAQIRSLSLDQMSRNNSLVTLGLSYDGFDGAIDAERSKVLDLIKSGDVHFITTHYVGSPFGNTNSLELVNRPEWEILNTSMPMIFSHSSYVSTLDAYLLRQTNQYISIAPESEQHAGHSNPHAHLIMDQASIAADSVFAYSTSLVHQARMWPQTVCSRLQQMVIDQWGVNINTPMRAQQAFYLATRGGALAVKRPDLGVIAVGAKADLVFYNPFSANLLGWRDPAAAIILHSDPRDISDVMVGGKFVKRNFQLILPNLIESRRAFLQTAQNFTQRYENWDFSELPHWFYLANCVTMQPVDVVRGNATGYRMACWRSIGTFEVV